MAEAATPREASGPAKVRKLIIFIPCLNEEQTLPATLADLPRTIPGVESVEWLIVNDGSQDATVQTARRHGVDHIVSHTSNRGLAAAFATGMDAALRLGADVIVQTDGDNQYNGGDIVELVRPILEGHADMVVGDRQTDRIASISWTKKRLQTLGSWVVRKASGSPIVDAASGFRAYSRDAAMRINVVSQFTYTVETLIQAGSQRMAVSSVPIRVNTKLRESRLIRNVPIYLAKQLFTLFRSYSMYKPLNLFVTVGSVLTACGVGLGVRFLYYFEIGKGMGHVQSVMLAVLLILLGFGAGVTGVLADLLSHHRRLVEEILWRVRRLEQPTAEANERKPNP